METELKFALSPQAQRKLERYLSRSGQDGTRHVEVLKTTYFDSADRKLTKAGFSLRVRQIVNGAQGYRQTVKSDGNGTFRRQEWEWFLDGPQPDLGRLAEVPAFPLQAAPLATVKPLFSTEVTRTTFTLRPVPGSTVEMALDDGAVVASCGSEPLRELELELKQGDPGVLVRLALELLETAPLSLFNESKAQRGFELVDGTRPKPHQAKDVVLPDDLCLKDAFHLLAGRLLDDLMANQPAVLRGDEEEGVHQMRIDVRRLRSLLVLFAPVLEVHATRHFEDELRRLGQVLGAARDWDVFVEETLPRLIDGAADLAVVRPLRELASKRRHSSHQAAKKAVLDPSFSRFVLAFRLWSFEKGAVLKRFAAGDLGEEADHLLSRLERKVDKRLRACDKAEPTTLHRLRKGLKKLRYAIEFFEARYGRGIGPYLKRCNGLQKQLGDLNDLWTFSRLADEVAQGQRLDVAPALGLLAENADRLAMKGLRQLDSRLRRFANAQPFWT